MLLHSLLDIIDMLIAIYELIILAQVILSWFVRGGSVMDTLSKITSPILAPCYKLQEKVMPHSSVDFSPVIAVLLLGILRRII